MVGRRGRLGFWIRGLGRMLIFCMFRGDFFLDDNFLVVYFVGVGVFGNRLFFVGRIVI